MSIINCILRLHKIHVNKLILQYKLINFYSKDNVLKVVTLASHDHPDSFALFVYFYYTILSYAKYLGIMERHIFYGRLFKLLTIGVLFKTNTKKKYIL